MTLIIQTIKNVSPFTIIVACNSAFNENSAVIVRYLDSFRIRRIQGVSVQEKISQMGTTEIAIIALSSVIFLGAVLGIVLLCSSCQRKLVLT